MKQWNNEKGFTMIEMMIVLLVISVVLLLAIPNLTNRSDSINDKGCEALVTMIEGQVEAYKLDFNATPGSIDDLVNEGYLKTNQNVCSNGKTYVISNGKVEEQAAP
ncbi:competence type IV pilus major pilin ComGC [Bacillus spongiae]|uniref:ComG operon protein 3 n=1 Tax=Bacillus spongiae TaxID=2683610 RepID=A0ABU8HFF1_9BACI